MVFQGNLNWECGFLGSPSDQDSSKPTRKWLSGWPFEGIDGLPVVPIRTGGIEGDLGHQPEETCDHKAKELQAGDSRKGFQYQRLSEGLNKVEDQQSQGNLPRPRSGESSTQQNGLHDSLDVPSSNEQPSISCYRFSADASWLLLGHTDGKVQLVSVDDGKIPSYANKHGRQVAACCFAFGDLNDYMLTVDMDGYFAAWTKEKRKASGYLGKTWKLPDPDGNPELQKASLSEDGGRLVCLVKVKGKTSVSILVSIFNARDVFPRLIMQVPIKDSRLQALTGSSALSNLEASGCLFSPDGLGLMVSLHDSDNDQGWVILWPDFLHKQNASYSLEGRFFCWSPDGCVAVTWGHSKGGSSELTNEFRVWDVLRMQPKGDPELDHPKFDVQKPVGNGEPEFIQEPVVLYDDAPIHWCGFLSNELLVTCTVDEGVNISVWDALVGRLVHTLGRKVGTESDHQPSELPAEEPGQGVDGLQVEFPIDCQSLAISHERSWIGMYSQATNEGYVWDGEMNRELLKFSLPVDCKCDGDVNLVFSQDAKKLAIVGQTRALVMCLSIGVESESLGFNLTALLEEKGPAALNYPNFMGVFVDKCTEASPVDELDKRLKKAVKDDVKVQFCLPPSFVPICGDVGNALYVALMRHLPTCVKILLERLMEGVTTDYSLSTILRDSLVELAVLYPKRFCEVMEDQRFVRKLGTFWFDEKAFRHTSILGSSKFAVMTDDRVIGEFPEPNEFSSKALSVWNERVPDSEVRGDLDEHDTTVNAEAQVVPVKDIAQIGKRGLIHNLLLRKVDDRVYATCTIKYVITYKWRTYGLNLLLEEFGHHAILLVMFTSYVFVVDRESTIDLVLLFLSVAMALMTMFREFQQLRTYWIDNGIKGLCHWFTSHWNLLELASYLLLIFVIPALHLAGERGDARVRLDDVLAVEVILLWSRLLYYAEPFEATGAIVIMIQEIIHDIWFFLFLGFAILFGFTAAFYITYRHSGDERNDVMEVDMKVEDQFGTFGRSMLTAFSMMLGDFEVDVLYAAPRPGVAITLFIVYMMGMMIILLNLLIAIMGRPALPYDEICAKMACCLKSIRFEIADLLQCSAVVFCVCIYCANSVLENMLQWCSGRRCWRWARRIDIRHGSEFAPGMRALKLTFSTGLL